MIKSVIMSLSATIAVIALAYPMAYFLAFRVHKHKALWIILHHHPVLDQLPAAGLRLEDRAGLQRRDQFRPEGDWNH